MARNIRQGRSARKKLTTAQRRARAAKLERKARRRTGG